MKAIIEDKKGKEVRKTIEDSLKENVTPGKAKDRATCSYKSKCKNNAKS